MKYKMSWFVGISLSILCGFFTFVYANQLPIVNQAIEMKGVHDHIHVEAPHFGWSGAAGLVINAAVKNTTEQMITNFKQSEKEAVLGHDSELYVTYKVIGYRPDYWVSIRFEQEINIGGMAHPAHQFQVINYDIRDCKILTTADVFRIGSEYLKALSDESKYQLRQLNQANPANAEWIDQAASPIAEHYAIWNLASDGVMITFPPGTVFPDYYGAVTTIVSYKMLMPYLQPSVWNIISG